ncbi:MAG: FAD-binding oxidoreductase [Mesorhizobium sp.]|nr:FAD-binding oxidoreductase [Mesorhizobium sp.]RWN26910.1 MAG: FAD-binding oxidoreductase [Mesorhizobium sp.]
MPDKRGSVMEVPPELARSFLGSVLQPDTPTFDEVRRIHNGLVDRRPAVIARCRGIADIVDAVRYAQATGLEICVRGGGHNVAGRAVVDDGLMIDLSLMKGVHVNAAAQTAVVEGGVTWKEFNRETQLHGLATTGGVIGTTGVAGLTLGGGLGWLMPKYGMALDNLISVDLVLADGSVVKASTDGNPDLFWALRGGGGNFGVAASFEFRLHSVGPIVYGGIVAFPFQQARQVLRGFRELAHNASDDLMLVAGLTTAPDGSGTPIVAIVSCHIGSAENAEAMGRRIRSLGTVAVDALGPIPYVELNGMLDAGFPSGAFNYWKSTFLPRLDDDAIEALVTAYESCPVPTSSILLEGFHGLAARIPVDATAFALRDSGFNALVLGQWMDKADGDRTTAWGRASFDALQPFAGKRRYANYLGADEEAGAAALAAYGQNLAKLRQLKTRYDPKNIFHHNVNIPPA